MKNNTQQFLDKAGAISLLLLPLLLMIAFALHYTNLADFFNFKFAKEPYDANRLVQTLTSDDGGFRRYTLPHLFGYLALPLFIFASLFLAKNLFDKAPKHAIVGAALTIIGTVFMGGVFGAWMSFAGVGNVPIEQSNSILPVITALTTMQGSLMLSSALSALTFIGMIILGFALYKSQLTPKLYAALFTLGNIIIIAFIDLDNLMFIGALLMLIGLLPLSIKFFRNNISRE